MVIQESAENYLETILILQKRNGTVRSIDIANELQFSKPSVTGVGGELSGDDPDFAKKKRYGTIH